MSEPLVRYDFAQWELTPGIEPLTCLAPNEQGRYYKAADVEEVLDDVKATMELLRDYTYLDAEPPELRAQNERCFREAQRLLEKLR